MNKSLLELLEEEKAEVINIIRCKSMFDEFSKNEDLYQDFVLEYKTKIDESEKRLTEIRKELKQYLSFLMEV